MKQVIHLVKLEKLPQLFNNSYHGCAKNLKMFGCF